MLEPLRREQMALVVSRRRRTYTRRLNNRHVRSVFLFLLSFLLVNGPDHSQPTHSDRAADVGLLLGFLRGPLSFACAATSIDTQRDEEHYLRRKSLKHATALSQADQSEGPSLGEIFRRAASKGLGGGLPGALAGILQVLGLMWLRTIINYQYRYGTNFSEALKTLLNEGGIPRLYRGLAFALVQGPISRFVSTAANDGVEAFVSSFGPTKQWGPGPTTVLASLVVGCARLMLMPIDTCKTVLQVDSVEGFRNLMRRVKAGRLNALYAGAMATAVSACLGHFPWFYTYALLAKSEWMRAMLPWKLLRNAGIGLAASVVSDTVVNSIRVVKTTKQSLESRRRASYVETVQLILAADGWAGLFGRGLRTRLFANAIQSIVFTVVWRGLADRLWESPGEDKRDGSQVPTKALR